MNPALLAVVAPPCPHLGMRDDASAYFSYPSTGNRCYRCRRPAIPLMAHQEAFCLKGAQQDCPAYLQTEGQAFPARCRAGQAARLGLSTSGMKVLAITVGVVALGFAAARFWPQIRALQLLGTSRSPAAAAIPPSVTSPPATASPSAVPTSTLIPTETALPQTHALDVPFEIDGIKLVMHRVGGGETFDILDAKYQTTPEVIRALNPSVGASLWANAVIVIAPGLQTVEPSLPGFRVHEVRDATITIDKLAVQYNIEAALLMRYNGCADACVLSAGDWVLFPVVKK